MEIELFNMTCDVTIDYTPAEKGHRDGLGQPLEPDHPASVELLTITTKEDFIDFLEHDLISQIEAEIERVLRDE